MTKKQNYKEYSVEYNRTEKGYYMNMRNFKTKKEAEEFAATVADARVLPVTKIW